MSGSQTSVAQTSAASGELSALDQMIIKELSQPGTHGRISVEVMDGLIKKAQGDSALLARLCGRMGRCQND